jgi:hypothetical protein
MRKAMSMSVVCREGLVLTVYCPQAAWQITLVSGTSVGEVSEVKEQSFKRQHRDTYPIVPRGFYGFLWKRHQ